jgi:hypothetical protein
MGWAAAIAIFTVAVRGDGLGVRLNDNVLSLQAAPVHFLAGKPLANLKDGATIAYSFQLSLIDSQRMARLRTAERFVISYDLWEERFSIAQLPRANAGGAAARASNLTLDAAEQWCIQRLLIPVASLGRTQEFRLRLEVRADQPRRRERRVVDESPVSLATLIEVFSRPARDQQNTWQSETAPFRIGELK